jgi:hypothetical protein
LWFLLYRPAGDERRILVAVVCTHLRTGVARVVQTAQISHEVYVGVSTPRYSGSTRLYRAGAVHTCSVEAARWQPAALASTLVVARPRHRRCFRPRSRCGGWAERRSTAPGPPGRRPFLKVCVDSRGRLELRDRRSKKGGSGRRHRQPELEGRWRLRVRRTTQPSTVTTVLVGGTQ